MLILVFLSLTEAQDRAPWKTRLFILKQNKYSQSSLQRSSSGYSGLSIDTANEGCEVLTKTQRGRKAALLRLKA